MEVLIVLMLFVALVAASIIFRGWVLSILWGWFIVPFGAPALSIAWAIGISCVVSMFTARAAKKKDEDDDALVGILTPYALGLLSLGVGWVAHVAM